MSNEAAASFTQSCIEFWCTEAAVIYDNVNSASSTMNFSSSTIDGCL